MTADVPFEIAHGSPKSQVALANKDIYDALKIWKLWVFLGWNDIKMRYRGSVLGPFWITFSMLIFITAFSVIYSRLFHQTLTDYVPFLTAGYLVWMMVASVMSDSCNVYVEAAAFITEIKLPYTLYLFRMVWRHLIIFFHNAVVFIAVALYFKSPLNGYLLLLLPSLFLLVCNLLAISMVLSVLGVKFRDIPPVVASVIQVAFFVTPVSWSPDLLGKASILIKLNPLYYFIDLVRQPLLGHAPSAQTWVVCTLLSLVVFSIAFLIFAKFRRNIPFWL